MVVEEEVELVARLKAHEQKAFTILVKNNQDRVYTYLVRMLGNDAEAAEVCQEVFIAAFRFIESFRGDGTLLGWLLRIASNMYKNRIRHNVRRKRSLESGFDDLIEKPNYRPIGQRPDTPESLIARQELGQALAKAIAKLPEEFREVLVLRDIELLPYNTIQEVTGLAEGTVKSRLHRARNHLARMLVDYLDGDTL